MPRRVAAQSKERVVRSKNNSSLCVVVLIALLQETLRVRTCRILYYQRRRKDRGWVCSTKKN